MPNNCRVRFAPSPTGPLHIGGVRTALFNYLFAKKHGGDFILRIEDTDQNRYIEGAEDYIISALNWCGIPFDEGPGKEKEYGPYRQSERKHLYRQYADQLIASGKAYYAFDTPDELNFHRKDHEEKGKTFIYNWHNRLKLTNSLSLSQEDTQSRLDNGADYVIRFLSPKDVTLELQDTIRGKISIDTNILDDKILFKSDGMPTYHLANVVDDHLMQITHVIRGEEWLPSLALHHLLYKAFDWHAPEFAHLPLIMKPTGKGKLSKRDGEKMGFPVFPLSWGTSVGYKEAGYYPEAVINFLALLGWNPGTEQEMFGLQELIETFSLDRVHKGGARFDPDKTKWYNHHYLQQQNEDELTERFIAQLDEIADKKQITLDSGFERVKKIIQLIKERASFENEFWNLSDFCFIAPEQYDEKATKKQWKEDTADILLQLSDILENISDFSAESVSADVKGWIGDKSLSFGKVMPPLRLVIVGEMKGPDLFEIMALIGKDDSIQRIKTAITIISKRNT